MTRFARAIVHAELMIEGADAREGVSRVVSRLHRELGRLIGSAGFDVLLARSLVLARRNHPPLDGITVSPGGTLAGLDGASSDPVALEESAVALISHFIELLATFIGEDLAMRLVRDVWPTIEEETT